MLPTAVLSCALNAGGGFVARVTRPRFLRDIHSS